MAAHGQRGGGRPGSGVDHHAELGADPSAPNGAPPTVSPSKTRRGPPARSPPVTGRTSTIPWGRPVRPHGDHMTPPRSRGQLPPGSGHCRPRPSHHQGQPLLTGASPDRPERDGQTEGQAGHGQRHPSHRWSGPDGRHPDEQTRGHGGNLASSPAGDHSTALQGREPVPRPIRSVALGSHVPSPVPGPVGPFCGGATGRPCASDSMVRLMSRTPSRSRPRVSVKLVPIGRGNCLT